MNFVTSLFNFGLLLSAAYAAILGGNTGRLGSAICVAATILTLFATPTHPAWDQTNYGVFLVDAACLLALMLLAFGSNRRWPIWAVGFQTIAVATHIATMIAPDTVPRAYHAILSLWGIPILGVMVAGTQLDRKFERRLQHKA
jgi:tellurite resistance protein TehA-like permease